MRYFVQEFRAIIKHGGGYCGLYLIINTNIICLGQDLNSFIAYLGTVHMTGVRIFSLSNMSCF